MKKINAWFKKFFGIGAGEYVETITVSEFSRIPDHGYKLVVHRNALKEDSTIIIDHGTKTVTFKMI